VHCWINRERWPCWKMKFTRDEFSRFWFAEACCRHCGLPATAFIANEAAIIGIFSRNSFVKTMKNEIRFHIIDLCKEFEVIGANNGKSGIYRHPRCQRCYRRAWSEESESKEDSMIHQRGYYYTINIPPKSRFVLARKKVDGWPEKMKRNRGFFILVWKQ